MDKTCWLQLKKLNILSKYQQVSYFSSCCFFLVIYQHYIDYIFTKKYPHKGYFWRNNGVAGGLKRHCTVHLCSNKTTINRIYTDTLPIQLRKIEKSCQLFRDQNSDPQLKQSLRCSQTSVLYFIHLVTFAIKAQAIDSCYLLIVR